MAIKVRAMTTDDYRKVGFPVKDSSSRDSNALLSMDLTSSFIFGSRPDKNTRFTDLSRDNKRGYIMLNSPIFNKFITREDGSLLSKILGIHTDTMKSLINFDLVWLKDDNLFESVSSIDKNVSRDQVLTGPEYILKVIDEFDIDSEIKLEFRRTFAGYFKSRKPKEININRHKGLKLTKGWFVETDIAITESEVLDYLDNVFYRGDSSRLAMLLNMTNKDGLRASVISYITVLPIGMRPAVGELINPTTADYADVIKANQGLMTTMSANGSVSEFINKLRDLNKAVSQLQYHSDKRKLSHKSIEEMLKTKHGHIRGNMLGKRQDCSGRSVVIINPELPIDTIKLPEDMIVKLYKYHVLEQVDDPVHKHLLNASPERIMKEVLRKDGDGKCLLDKVPALLGRHPTLHHLGILAFKVLPTKKHAIEVPALICPGYNMDFDGDTGHTRVPFSWEAVKEAWVLMLSSQNLFTQKDGECTVLPRQDMIYGLYIATKTDWNKPGTSYNLKDYDEAFDKVYNYKIKVYDKVTIQGKTMQAGVAAFKACFAIPNSIPEKVITKKTIKEYVNQLVETSTTDRIVQTLHNIVQLGFQMSKYYSPTMSIFYKLDTDKRYKKFLEDIRPSLEYMDMGFMDEDTFSLEFSQHYDDMIKGMLKDVKEELGDDNGFISIAKCGARGNDSNIQQVFACKGSVIKSGGKTFNCIINKSYVSQLSPFQHYLTAYGGRSGLIDKTLTTGVPGYMGRKVGHTTQGLVIRSEDCGTTEGIVISKRDIIDSIYSVDWEELNDKFIELANSMYQDIDSSKLRSELNANYTNIYYEFRDLSKVILLESMYEVDMAEVDDQFKEMISGRYIISNGMSHYLSGNEATLLVKDNPTLSEVSIRSPITCKKPCCSVCYGMDLGNHKRVAVGTAVGIIAAQSLTEPGTQMTMNQFHQGGVAKGGGDMTSAFDRLAAYLETRSFKKTSTYDPVAWATGSIEEKRGLVEKRVSIKGSSHSVSLPLGAKLKKYVHKGENICKIHGDTGVDELVKYDDFRHAQVTLMHILYQIYKANGAISSKHFEVVISMMTMLKIIDTDRKDLGVGYVYHASKVFEGEDIPSDMKITDGVIGNTRYIPSIYSVKYAPTNVSTAFSKFMLEDIGRGLSKCIFLGLEDDISEPLQQILLGQRPKIGTYYPDYALERERR